MTATRAHYDELLGPVYAWMVGDFDAAASRSDALLERFGITAGPGALAVDLGCGHGTAAVPLADRGFRVVAIDFCRALLDELEAVRGERAIRAVEADVLEFRRHVDAPAGIVVCLGDTLPHLPSVAALERLLHEVAAALEPGGTFIATFRDYVSRELEGDQRFIPVRSSADRILTCVLEYEPEAVVVHDLLHVRDGSGWRQQVSTYSKLRLDPARLAALAESAGLDVIAQESAAGLVTFAAVR